MPVVNTIADPMPVEQTHMLVANMCVANIHVDKPVQENVAIDMGLIGVMNMIVDKPVQQSIVINIAQIIAPKLLIAKRSVPHIVHHIALDIKRVINRKEE